MINFSYPDQVSLKELKDRITASDLVPSRIALLEGIDQKFEVIAQRGVKTWAELIKVLKNPKDLDSFALLTDISNQYLTLLKRESDSYLQKPFALKEISWMPGEVIHKLAEAGIANSISLIEKANEDGEGHVLAKKIGVDPQQIQYLLWHAHLTRIQWVSPNFARMLIEAGYEDAKKVALANADELCERLDQINVGGKYFRGKVGLRDTKRLIYAANFV